MLDKGIRQKEITVSPQSNITHLISNRYVKL
jgi:hypothetical protein